MNRSFAFWLCGTLFLLHCGKNNEEGADMSATADLRAPRDFAIAPSGDQAGADLVGSTADLTNVPSPDLTAPVVPPDLVGCPARTAALGVVAVGNDRNLFVARFTTADGWHDKVRTGGGVIEEITARGRGTGLVVAGRQTDNQLVTGIEVDCQSVAPMLAPVTNASTGIRPALRLTANNDVVFRGAIGNDHRYYSVRFDAAGAAAPVEQGNFLSLTTPSLYGTSEDAIALVFVGDNNKLYDGVTNGTGGSATEITGATSTRPVASVTLGSDQLVVFSGTDTNLYFVRKTGTTWSAPKSLCDGQSGCSINSNQPPTLALDSTGQAFALWVGKDGADLAKDKGVYASLFNATDNQFGAAAQVTDEVTHDPVAASAGADATLEVVWVRDGDGFLRHARLQGTWQAATTIEDAPFRTRPELVKLQ